MKAHAHTGHKLEELCGVPAQTIYRFLNGTHGEPRSETLMKLAHAYNITEAQLRGLVPLDKRSINLNKVLASLPPEELVTPRLTLEEQAAVKVMRSIPKSSRGAWLKIGKELSMKRPRRERRQTYIDGMPSMQPQLPLEITMERRDPTGSNERRNSPRQQTRTLPGGHNHHRGCGLKQAG